MCGISGIFNKNGIDNNMLEFIKATQIIEHRGKDGQGYALFNVYDKSKVRSISFGDLPQQSQDINLALGHRRLAIIDTTPAGLQPMANEDNTVWIIYNGEIYNYIELHQQLVSLGHKFKSQSDTEVIIHAYEEWGNDCVNLFNGIWSFAIVDLKRSIIFCSRDRFGVKPFYYYFDGHNFVFGSEIKQLLEYQFVHRKLNEGMVYEYLAYSALEHCEETFFVKILKLMQGNNLIFDMDKGTLAIKTYYHPELKINNRITYTEACEEFRRLLADSVRLQLRSDVEVGSCLSGGLDSSSIVCLMNILLKKQGKDSIQHTFSSHFDVKEANEIEYAQEVINKTGVSHTFVYPTGDELLKDLEHLIWHQEEPFGSTSIFAQWSVFRLVNKHGIKVMLDGQGADEQLGGYVNLYYEYLKELRAKRQFVRYIYETYQYIHLHKQPVMGYLLPKYLRNICSIVQKPKFELGTGWINSEMTEKYQSGSRYLKIFNHKEYGDLDYLNNLLYRLTFQGNLQQLLKYEDKNSMAFSVEARVPFLDHRLVEFNMSLPPRFKMRDGMTKRVLRDGMVGILPEKIRCRISKLGFATPEKLWQCTILKPLIEKALRDEKLQPFVIPEKALSYYNRLEDSGYVDFACWKWLNFSLWREIYNV